jgi:hypothetical protein
MRTLKVITASLAIGSLLAFAACKKDDKKKEDDTTKADEKTDDTTAAGKTTDDTANPCANTDENPCGGGDMSMDDKKAMAGKVVTMFEQVAKAVEENAEDCAKMAEAVQKLADDNKELIAQGKSMDEDPEFKKWFDETHGEKLKTTMTGAMTAMMKKCGQDEGVKKAFSSLTGE